MSESIIVENLAKRYELGRLQQATQLREQIANLFQAPFRRRREKEILWALQGVTFKVDQGEVVGIIGRNGAGKSTLLKILSKITYPTSGSVETRGRVASLLEVGTGFHEELTGRENVFLNGSILGMKKKEVVAKLDQIVSFAGVERFIDTPIKRYSSGMRLRLGFAVAAHLEPDILIVDEVLAVGDAGFQKKCISAMEDMRGGGRTVLFVSHNMAAVENLCSRGIWIDSGRVRMDGPTHEVLEGYMGTFADADGAVRDLSNIEGRRGSGQARYTKVEFLSADGTVQSVTRAGKPLAIRMHYYASERIPHPSLGFRITTEMGTLITETSTSHHDIHIPYLPAGAGYVELEIESLNLMPARYFFSLGLSGGPTHHLYDFIDNAVHLDVETASIYGSSRSWDSRAGIVFFPQRWHFDGMGAEATLLGEGKTTASAL